MSMSASKSLDMRSSGRALAVALGLWLAAATAACGSKKSPASHADADGHAETGGDGPSGDERPDARGEDAPAADARDAATPLDADAGDAGDDRPARTDGATTDGTSGAPCWDDNDCHPGAPNFLLCQAPGESFGCPVCDTPLNACTADPQCADAGATAICEPASCACHGERTCVAGCSSDAQCPAGEVCGANHRCAAKPCSTDVACPTDFSCMPGAGCQRKRCLRDADCSFACVKGACYDRPGTCVTPPA
jgi:hypothetical protein